MTFLKLWAESFIELGAVILVSAIVTALWVAPTIAFVLWGLWPVAILWAVVYLVVVFSCGMATSL